MVYRMAVFEENQSLSVNALIKTNSKSPLTFRFVIVTSLGVLSGNADSDSYNMECIWLL